ncbi:MAG TPA: XRE family transcriptional regulator [Ruminococcaceae bacterium]|nr:XRE family transcriptional regulator [Oscillospiraceae bacterium]
MNNDFPRIITFLRKERGLSQKQAAADLGISQALLSHYEKGIRECGLDFLIKAADYYDVTTDYMLGRTLQRTNSAAVSEQSGDDSDGGKISGNMINQINRRVIANSTSVVFDLLAQIGSKKLTNTVSNYLMCSVYETFRIIYSSEKTNSQSLFSLDKNKFQYAASASMALDLMLAEDIIEEEKIALALSPDILSAYFDKSASSLFSLIQFSERNIRNTVKK